MLTHIEASLKMDYSIRRAQVYLKESGYVYPYLYLMNKDTPTQLEYSHPKLLDIGIEEIGTSPINVYGTLLVFNEITQDEVHKVARELIAKTNPDAIGYTMTVVFKQFLKKDFKRLTKDYQAAMDPESSKGVHSCYYIRGDHRISERIIPFIDRGPIPNKNAFEGGESEKHDLMIIDTPWLTKNEEIDPWFTYPYNK